MTFFNRKMVENKSLKKAWRAAHLTKIDEDEEICLPEICDEIARRIRRNRRPSRRLSLRSFSVLLSGATRIYSRQLNLLLKDTFNCSQFTSATAPRPVLPVVDKSPVTNTSTGQSESTNEYPDDTESSFTDDFHESSYMADDSTVFTVTPNSNTQITSAGEKSEERRDQQIQTSPIPESVGNIGGFDPNIPFGYIIVHDNFHSRLPSKVLFSNLSENVKFLPIYKPMN